MTNPEIYVIVRLEAKNNYFTERTLYYEEDVPVEIPISILHMTAQVNLSKSEDIAAQLPDNAPLDCRISAPK